MYLFCNIFILFIWFNCVICVALIFRKEASKYSLSPYNLLIVFCMICGTEVWPSLFFVFVFVLCLFFCFLLNNPLACSLLAIPRTLPGGQAGVLQHSLLPHQRGLCFYWGTQTSETQSSVSFIWQWRPMVHGIKCVQYTEHLLTSMSVYWCCSLNKTDKE